MYFCLSFISPDGVIKLTAMYNWTCRRHGKARGGSVVIVTEVVARGEGGAPVFLCCLSWSSAGVAAPVALTVTRRSPLL
jgi:hypothetical protein